MHDEIIGRGDMKRIVLLRHGESIWNKENRFTGWTDVPLSDKGVDADIAELNIPTATPLIYELEDDMKPIRRYYLGSRDDVKNASEAVREQSGARA